MNAFQFNNIWCLRAGSSREGGTGGGIGGGGGGDGGGDGGDGLVWKKVVNNFNYPPRKSRRIYDSDEKKEAEEENQLRESIHKWLSPPDPSTNHNIACATHLKRTAAWFFQGTIFREWKNQSGAPLLWIHGKRAPCLTPSLTPSDAVLYL